MRTEQSQEILETNTDFGVLTGTTVSHAFWVSLGPDTALTTTIQQRSRKLHNASPFA